MPTLPHLDTIVQILEKDPNSSRIKKVLLCAYNGRWENDANQLKNLDLSQLIQDIHQKYQQLDQFSVSLNNILSRLNKKNEYTKVVNTILNEVSQVYSPANAEPTKGISIDSITASETVKISPEELNSLSSAYSSINGTSHSPLRALSVDLYEVRFKIMQHTNPLRAKLVIFSSLEREFNYRDEDWSQLKNHSLDDLLRQLLQAFPNLDRLKSHLYKMAEYLEDIDENIQVVTVILEALTPYYDHRKQSTFLSLETAAYEDNATIHYPDPNLLMSEPVDLHHSILQEQFLTPNSFDINESETLHLLRPEKKGFDFNIEENNHQARGVTEGNFSDFTSATVIRSESLAKDTDSRGVSDLIERKLRLEQEIEEQINHRVADALIPLTTILRHLELSLSETLKNQPSEVRLEIKYKSLKEFVDLIQSKVEDLKVVLDQSEAEEHQKLSLNKTILAYAGEHSENPNNRVTQNQLLELAKQGHAKAIATVISQTLKSKDINTLAKSKDGCLHIILESDPVPNQASMSQFVHHKLLDLQIKSIEKVKIYARTPGNKSMAWSQEFIYKATQH